MLHVNEDICVLNYSVMRKIFHSEYRYIGMGIFGASVLACFLALFPEAAGHASFWKGMMLVVVLLIVSLVISLFEHARKLDKRIRLMPPMA